MKIWGVGELAQYLKVSPLTVYRKVKRKEIPYFKVGRHLKFSQEMIDEWLQTLAGGDCPFQKTFFAQELIDQIKEKIISEIHPQKIILFGSYAWGMPTKESDIDLCIIHSTTLEKRKRARLIRDLLFSFCHPLDIVVYTPEEVEAWQNTEGSFLKKILDDGKIIYDEKKH